VAPFEGRYNSLEKGRCNSFEKRRFNSLEKGKFGNRKAGAGKIGRRSVLRDLSEIVECVGQVRGCSTCF
jgi:hypothetical protein